MTRKYLALFWLIVCLPLAVIVVIGWRLARDEHGMARQRLREVMLVRLHDTALVVSDYFQRRERRLDTLLESVSLDPDSLRQLVRREPHVGQVFVLQANGTLLHPDPGGQLNDAERRFLTDSRDMFAHNDLLRAVTGGDDGAAPAASGWVVRFWGSGLNMVYWRRLPSGKLAGVLMQRARWIADLIAVLPETADAARSSENESWETRIRLIDSNGRAVYEWGSFEPDNGAAPFQELAPAYPLSSWRLQHFVDESALATVGRGAYFNFITVLAATGLVLVMAGALFYREYKRQVREALQRVSFVNQVSHELKTPLTNIRMYAELLESDLQGECAEQDQAPRDHLKVIVEESQRLSRLIGNVLTFAQQERSQLILHPRAAVVDDVIATVIQRFDPALRRRGVEVVFERSAGALVEVDVDALEQILGNLLGNVEKYAATGKRLEVVSRQASADTVIVLSDDGPGIPARHRERVFRPFQRLSNDIADSPGTGIGLSIARQLARLHGGDLVLVPSARGATFEVRLDTPRNESEASA